MHYKPDLENKPNYELSELMDKNSNSHNKLKEEYDSLRYEFENYKKTSSEKYELLNKQYENSKLELTVLKENTENYKEKYEKLIKSNDYLENCQSFSDILVNNNI